MTLKRSDDLKEPLALDEGIGPDPLQWMLDTQARLHLRLSTDPELGWSGVAQALNSKYFDAFGSARPEPIYQGTLLLIDNAQMLGMEAAEVLDWLPWKKHKRDYGRKLTDEEREKVIEEVIDCLHFVFNLFYELGVRDSREVARRYLAKNNVNHARQDRGY